MKKLLEYKYALPVLCLLGGIAIGAIFYPSKSITREETAKYEETIQRLENEKRDIEFKAQTELFNKQVEFSEKKSELQTKISSLTTENTILKQSTKETMIKIIKPDGTITEKSYKESDTEIVSQIVTDIKQEFNEKVTSIENKWKEVHEKRVVAIKDTYEKQLSEKQHIIDEYSKKETIKINERKFGVSLGYTSYSKYFSSISYDVFGPFFLDLHLESDSGFSDSGAGVGLGFRF